MFREPKGPDSLIDISAKNRPAGSSILQGSNGSPRSATWSVAQPLPSKDTHCDKSRQTEYDKRSQDTEVRQPLPLPALINGIHLLGNGTLWHCTIRTALSKPTSPYKFILLV